MDFSFTKEQLERKKEYDTFFEELMKSAPKEYIDSAGEGRLSSEEAFKFMRKVQKKLGEKGWSTMAWPKEHGGLGATYIEQLLFTLSAHEHDAPMGDTIGISICAPGIIAFGTDEQKKRLLPPIARGDVLYCQGWSEPDAGSDLASLSTTAIRQGEEYVINGQKIWTSQGHRADCMYLLARTDPDSKRSRGLSMFHVDMKSPGIEVRPLYMMDGSHMFNEVFIKDLRIPAKDLIGEEGKGWMVTFASMSTERSGFFLYAQSGTGLHRMIDYLRKTKRNGRYLSEDPIIRQKIARLYAVLQGGVMMGYRIANIQDEKGSMALPQSLPSESKVIGSELEYEIYALATEVMGMYGAMEYSRWAPMGDVLAQYQMTPSTQIAMGSNEIQRNIIAWDGLKMPRLKFKI
jgi:alkylation response protein AidB-like acyl-CoA dehydrogenase